jgi:hypothetical protein
MIRVTITPAAYAAIAAGLAAFGPPFLVRDVTIVTALVQMRPRGSKKRRMFELWSVARGWKNANNNNGRTDMRELIAASFLALGFSVIGSSCVSAQTAEQQCSHEWQALKSSGNPQGWTEPAFMTGCKNHHTFSTNPSGLGPAEPTPSQASANGKTASQCATDYAANKAAIKATGQTKRTFIAACRHGG